MKKRHVLTFLLVTAALLSGCGYATNNVFRSDIKTVYVEFFDNKTFRRELEVELTKAVVEEIKLRTPFIIAPKDRADSILGGEIVDFRERAHVKSEDDQILLAGATAEVRFRWRDRLTGTDIVPEQTVVATARVAGVAAPTALDAVTPPRVQRGTLDLAPFGRLFQKTAQSIVEKMQKNW
ncbi:MAG: LptE family protein [Candidatus Brocadiae bacterium]|nr:LptE family protein [Candidatus Brocadiia bacterium]